MDAMLVYPWPGNVRELKSALEQALLRGSGPVLRLEDFPLEITRTATPAAAPPTRASASA